MTPEQRRAWRESVWSHPELTDGQKLILLVLESFSDWPTGLNARPGVERLALMCGHKTRSVEEALSRGRTLGLIEQTERANPRRGRASCYRLLISTRMSVRIEDLSTRTDMRIEPEFYPHETDFNPHADALSTRTPVQPTYPRPIHNTDGRTDMRVETNRRPEPRRSCRRHPSPWAQCNDCIAAERDWQNWTADEAAARDAAIAACPDCDEFGQIDHGDRGVSICAHQRRSA